MSLFDDIAKDALYTPICDVFCDEVIYDSRRVVLVSISESVPYSDEDGSVIANIDEARIFNQTGLTIENGKTLETSTKTYVIQRFLRKEGEFKVYEIL